MKINEEEFANHILKQGPNTKIYFGADSERLLVDERWVVDYLLVAIVHSEGKHGGKVFGEVHREYDYDKVLSKPKLRLMTEVYKISELFLRLAPLCNDFDIEVHLDLNPDIKFGSSCAVKEAIGYIRGTCNMTPICKPKSWAASNVADALKRIRKD